MKLTAETEDNLVRARMELLSRFPFFGELVKYLRPQLTETITQTACIDKKGQMHLNPGFANKANAADLLFVLAHEAMHLVNSSAARFPEKGNFPLWARAADIAINYLLVAEGGVKLPRPQLIQPLYEGLERYYNMTHEEIYESLLQNPMQARVVMGTGFWCDEASCSCTEEMEAGEAQKWGRRIQSAAEAAKGCGKLPGGLEQFLAELGRPKKNWLRVLTLATDRELRRSYTWRRPNRRTTALGVVTPSQDRRRPEVVLYLDTSGSMDDGMVNEGLSEIRGILRMTRTTLILGDAEIYFCGPVRLEELNNLPMQRGGTDFSIVFERIKKEKLKPQLFIGFSDLEAPFPEQPAYPVIWCRSSGSHRVPPWGQLITM